MTDYEQTGAEALQIVRNVQKLRLARAEMARPSIATYSPGEDILPKGEPRITDDPDRLYEKPIRFWAQRALPRSPMMNGTAWFGRGPMLFPSSKAT